MNICGFNDRVSVDFGITKVLLNLLLCCVVLCCFPDDWGAWTPCSEECGGGTQSRQTMCGVDLCGQVIASCHQMSCDGMLLQYDTIPLSKKAMLHVMCSS